MYNKFFLNLIILTIFLPLVQSYYYADWYFCDEDNQPANNYEMIGWQCVQRTSSDCGDVNRNRPFVIDTMSLSSGSDNHIRTNFVNPVANEDWYIWYAYKEGYRANYKKMSLYQHSGNPTFWFSEGCNYHKFTKKDNCQATFTSSITACAEAGLPLSILTDTNLSADTRSAFEYPGIYVPPELDDWIKVNTQMNVNIEEEGTSNSVQGYPQSQQHDIYADESHNFNFLWQTSFNTVPGNYEITMTSTVPDAKCDQTNDVATTKTMTVHIAPSLDGCRAEIQNFNMVTSNLNINQELRFTGEKLNTYQNWSYTSISACNVENAELTEGRIFGTSYTLTIRNRTNNQVVATETETLPDNLGYNTPRTFTLDWTPTEYGPYEAVLETESTGNINVCNGLGITASATTPFDVGHDNDNDGWFDIGGDCDDDNSLINPAAIEICDSIDNNCVGGADENDVCTQTDYYCNLDGDAYFSNTVSGFCSGTDCIPTGCQAAQGNDCNDTNPSITIPLTYYRDQDQDTYGDPNVEINVCPQNKPNDYVSNNLDCNDNNANINPSPSTIEDCENGVDDNCNILIDCDDPDCVSIFDDFRRWDICTNECQTNYYDYNDQIAGCEYYCVVDGKEEECDSLDNDCDGDIDNILDSEKPLCLDFTSLYSNVGVCEDALATCQYGVWACVPTNIPNFELQESSCDNLDNDCDGVVDSFTVSLDEIGECSVNTRICEDGYWTDNIFYIASDEVCDDDLDNDCDGDTDEGCDCTPVGRTRDCGSSNTGECRLGIQTCQDDETWGNCIGAVNPSIEICDGLDNDCDSDTDEGNADCCSPDGRTRDCDEDPDCPGLPGKESCVNYQWSNICKADCPKEKPELKIINPEQDSRHYSCDDELNIPLNYDYPGLCQYQLNTMKSFRNTESTINAPVGSNKLTIKCGSEVKSVGFLVIKNDNCVTNEQEVDDETKELFKNEGIDENLIDIAENTPVDLEHQFSYLGDETHIISSIIPKKELKEFDYYLYIPKCVLEELGDVTLADLNIAYKDYEIIKEDPIIAWHFVNVNDRIDLNIDVKGRISEDCLKQIRGLPIAKALGVDVHIEKPFDWKNYLAPIIVIIIAVGIAGEFIYFKKHHHLDEPHTEKEHEQNFINKEWNILYKKIKQMKPKTAQQADNAMKNLNYNKAEREYILKKLKLK